MKKNIGRLDKNIRLLSGIAIIILGAQYNSVWGVAGMIPIISAQTLTCPLYWILGITTKKEISKVSD